jgi:hypothetical protein
MLIPRQVRGDARVLCECGAFGIGTGDWRGQARTQTRLAVTKIMRTSAMTPRARRHHTPPPSLILVASRIECEAGWLARGVFGSPQ